MRFWQCLQRKNESGGFKLLLFDLLCCIRMKFYIVQCTLNCNLNYLTSYVSFTQLISVLLTRYNKYVGDMGLNVNVSVTRA